MWAQAILAERGGALFAVSLLSCSSIVSAAMAVVARLQFRAAAASFAALRSPALALGSPALRLPRAPAARGSSGASAKVESTIIKAVKDYVSLRHKEMSDDVSSGSKNLEFSTLALPDMVTKTSTWDSLGFDDLDKVEVLLEVEEAFEHMISDDDADRIASVEQAITYFQKTASG
eukprot:NODE_4609_length_657_cov_77.564784.p1 GENE.NODE_4609_length_657_cov_77.564784~~NODE_4609_length_657_cov_77.564784.p1  ORF type:complete len:175 (+),score=54.78 NODE_4609_length_657_cov_77.564784:3-527(+)